MKPHRWIIFGSLLVTSGVVIAAAAASTGGKPMIPVFTGPPKGVPRANYTGSARGDPNDIQWRITVLRTDRSRLRAATDTTPPISGTEALGLAWQQLGPSAEPTGATATLASLPDGTPVWVVTYTGVCMGINFGNPLLARPTASASSDTSNCTGSIELNADTGEFMVAT